MTLRVRFVSSVNDVVEPVVAYLTVNDSSLDLFEPQYLIVPTAGVKAWLAPQIASRLGATEGIHDGVGTARAGTDHGIVRSAQVVTHGDLSGGNIQDHLRDEERIETGCAVSFGKFSDLVLESNESANTTSEYHTNAIGIDVLFIESGIQHGLVADNEGQLREAIEFAGFFFIEELSGLKILDLAGKARAKLRGIKLGDGCCTGYTVQQRIPILIEVIADGSQGADTGHHYAFQFHG